MMSSSTSSSAGYWSEIFALIPRWTLDLSCVVPSTWYLRNMTSGASRCEGPARRLWCLALISIQVFAFVCIEPGTRMTLIVV